MAENDENKVGQAKKKGAKAAAMVPLFSWRSIIVVTVGLIVGVVGSLAYWIMGPSLSSPVQEAPASGGLLQSLAPTPLGPWKSKVSVQVVNPGSSVMALRQLQAMGEYYAAKANSLPFLQFLVASLAKDVPGSAYTVDEVDQMLEARYGVAQVSITDIQPPAIEIRVTAPTLDEAAFLIDYVPKVFVDYLATEESKKQKQEYQNAAKEADDVKKAILEAEKQMADLRAKGALSDDISNNPKYLALNAKIAALQRALTVQADQLSAMIVSGNVTRDQKETTILYGQTLQEARDVSAALSAAEKQLRALGTPSTGPNLNNNATYIMLNAKIEALQVELNRLMTGYTTGTGTSATRIPGLAEMVVYGTNVDSQWGTPSAIYVDTMKKVEVASSALAEARSQLTALQAPSNQASDLERQLAQDKVNSLSKQLDALRQRLALLDDESTRGTASSGPQAAFERTSAALAEARKELAHLESDSGEERLTLSLDYKAAQGNIVTLNKQMSVLNDKLSSALVRSADALDAADYLAVGNPSMPSLVLPERAKARNVLMMGAVLGAALAWLAMNFRWLLKTLSAMKEEAQEE